MSDKKTERHEFQAEVRQLLDIVIHSLYTDKEIFARELVSNAADALEKLRHLQLTEKEIFDDRLDLEINLTTDDAAGTVTVQDFGAGMTRAELTQNIGTIAHSGARDFLNALKEAKDAEGDIGRQLIGQFGVGFYSVFMVAKRVSLYTRSWHPEGEHLLWTSDGGGSYEIETAEGQRRGCKIIVFLKDEDKEFAKAERVREILGRYSRFVPFPISLNGERVNTVQALWLKNKNEIKEEEYKEFYKYQTHALDEPLHWLHFTADAPITINALLYAPGENRENWGFGRLEPGVSLYCKKILIENKPEGLLPEWLRFVRGVVDSADLPLNISRETMQDSALVRKINQVLTGRYLKFLEDMAKRQPEKYGEFYKTFGMFLKEGAVMEPAHRERLAKLLRCESSLLDAGEMTSLEDCVKRAKEEQKEIYYLYAQNRAMLEDGPYLEAFQARNIEVLFLYEPVDEFVMSQLREFAGKKLVSANQADLRLGDIPAEGEALAKAETDALAAWLKEKLGGRASWVGAGNRLVRSPAAVLNDDKFATPAMRRLMKAMQPDAAANPPARLEINPRHPLIKNLAAIKDKDPERAGLVAEQLFDNALAAAGLLEDPRPMVNRIYRILEMTAAPPRS